MGVKTNTSLESFKFFWKRAALPADMDEAHGFKKLTYCIDFESR